jgi:hypothetical protein
MSFDQILKLAFDDDANAAPIISAGDFSGSVPNLTASVSDAESVSYSLGALTCNETVTWTIESGNGAGKFAINSSTSEITLAETLNFWNMTSYTLTVRATDGGGLFDEVDIVVTVTNAYSANEIAYWKSDETSGTVMNDSAATNGDGLYVGATVGAVDFPHGGKMPLYDGINDIGRIGDSAAFRAAVNKTAGTLLIWFQPFDATFWDGTGFKFIAQIGSDTNNQVTIFKTNAANQLVFRHVGGGTTDSVTVTSYSETAMKTYALTWDSSGGGEFKAYIDAVQQGTTQTALGTWVNDVADAWCGIMDAGIIVFPAKGYVAHIRVFNTDLPATEIAKLNEQFAA